MAFSAAKHAPVLIVLVASGVCAWPYVGMTTSSASTPAAAKAKAAAAAGKPVELPPGLLNATPVPRPARDPFRDPEHARAAVKAKVSNALTALLARVKPMETARRLVAGKAGPGAGAASASATAKTKPGAKDGPLDPRIGLVLNATTVVDNHGFAVLSGKSHGVGDAVRIPGADQPCLLVAIRQHEVDLLYNGKRWPLGYAGSRGTASAGAAMAGGGNTALALNGDENQTAPTAPKGPKTRRPAARRRALSGN
jgi:hypothetical protein